MEGNRQSVFEVYNKIGDWFAENRPQNLIEKSYLDKLISLIPSNGSILDVGCGTGVPILNYFQNKGFKVTGVDASEKMLSLAQRNFPSTAFILADMRKLPLLKKHDAIIAWHSFFHLPATDQPDMFTVFQNHLNPEGILLFTSGTTSGEVWGMNGGENLFHASLNTDEYKQLLEEHHFKILVHVVDDAECGNATVWMAQYNPL
ncbi:class I SAM-dependent DNA methyltransferase [Pedobacter rhodius]|uniref:Class I SAM-dependent methyltransferase n=1 Tax=Pedobacter rhodius TaxID=3004098 RepID=A0ABT4L2S9_9SPHI|nr:class I SAM-dependent methyltransferase [Pedobacter sp. SJ11]MCZ4225501.1 class I SAM-dependent methyltransferase [Pedobacter sp. SJ11]